MLCGCPSADGAGRWLLAGALAAAVALPLPAMAGDRDAAPLARALAAQEARLGTFDPRLLPSLDALARARWRDGDLAAAAALRRRALGIAAAAFGPDSPSTAAAMAALARAHLDRNRYLDAEPLLIVAERVLDGAARTSGAYDRPLMAAILTGLARVDLARGDTQAALKRASRATEIARLVPHAVSGEPLRALGAALTAAGRYEQAEAVLREALARDTREHRADDAEAARSLVQLANLELRRGNPARALPLVQQAIAIDQQTLGATHPFLADDWHDLGLAYEALNRDGRARQAFDAALAVLDHGAGRDTPRVAYVELELSRLYRRRGDDAAAEAAFRDARRILNKAEAEEHRRERRV
jgi:tetratricopeptide (TPR) repeat protein